MGEFGHGFQTPCRGEARFAGLDRSCGEPVNLVSGFYCSHPVLPNDGWLGPVLGRYTKGRRYWAAYWNGFREGSVVQVAIPLAQSTKGLVRPGARDATQPSAALGRCARMGVASRAERAG